MRNPVRHSACGKPLFYYAEPLRMNDALNGSLAETLDGKPMHNGDLFWPGFPMCPSCKQLVTGWGDMVPDES